MNYELAKQLKDAGFSQKFPRNYMADEPYFPSLSELIEACGDSRYFCIERDASNRWRAVWDKEVIGDFMSDIQDTPEEAVAKLWLELQKSV